MYDSRDMEHNWHNFFFCWTIFCLFTPLTAKKMKISKKKFKKMPGDIITLYKCTKNHDHMLYCSWDIVSDRYNCYFSFWAIFCPFTPITAKKWKSQKKWKNPLEIPSFYTTLPKIKIICYTVPYIWYMTDVIVIFHFRLLWGGDIIILQMCTKIYY